MRTRDKEILNPEYEVFHEELRFKNKTIFLPGGWYWEDQKMKGMLPNEDEEVVMFAAGDHDGDGYIYYDGIDRLKVDGVSYDDCGSARRAVKEANEKIIKKIASIWAAHEKKKKE